MVPHPRRPLGAPLLLILSALVPRPDGASSFPSFVSRRSASPPAGRRLALPPPRLRAPPRAPARDAWRRGAPLRDSSDVAQDVGEKKKKEEEQSRKSMTTLRFVGSTSYTTEEVPRTDGARTIADFFAMEDSRDLCLRGSDNAVEPYDDVTPRLMGRWAAEAERMGAAAPEDGDKVVTVTTAGINFPGLRLLSIATIGTKLILPPVGEGDGESPDPEYEFTLIRDEVKPEGPRPLVWVFNRLTGAGGKATDGDDKEQTTHSLSRFRVKPVEGEGNSAVLTSNAYLEVDVTFPTLLLKILPVSKEKAEEQGSQSVQKAVEKDVAPALERFRDAYLDWLKQ